MKQAQAISDSQLFDEVHDQVEDFWNQNDNKEEIRETIEKMRNMNNMYFDLDDSDVEGFQDILQDDDLDDTDLYFPRPIIEKIEPDLNFMMTAPLNHENGSDGKF